MLNSQDILDMLNQGYSEAEVAEAVTASLNEAISTKREADRIKADVEAQKIAARNEQRDAIRYIYCTIQDYVETYIPDAKEALGLDRELTDEECDELIKSFESCLGIFTFLDKLCGPEDKVNEMPKAHFNDDTMKNGFDKFIDKFNNIFN